MGNLTSTTISQQASKEHVKLLMIGLDCAGKTTILWKLKNVGEKAVATTIPTIGFKVESLNLPGTIIAAWNVGGRSRIRPLVRQYYKDVDGIIFVVDSNTSWRMGHAKDELYSALDEDDLGGKPLLIFCNKQDLPNAISPSEMSKQLELAEKVNDRKWNVVGCTAIKGEGLHDGLNWLSTCIQGNEENTLAQKDDDSHMTEDTVAVLSEDSNDDGVDEMKYDPTEAGRNLTLKHFRPIQNGTECSFAKAAKLWGGYPANDGGTLEEQAEANVVALTEFVNRSNAGEKVDGFCIELNDPKAVTGGPKELGECVRRVLKTLSEYDPAGEAMMSKTYIASRGWRFRFNKADFFVTTFAPCYPLTSSRYAFGTGHAFLLLQPEASFARHRLPDDTPETKWEAPMTIRDKTRVAFRQAGRITTQHPPAEHIVKPLNDDGTTVVFWWKA